MNRNNKTLIAIAATIIFVSCSKELKAPEQGTTQATTQIETVTAGLLSSPRSLISRRMQVFSKPGLFSKEIIKFRELLGPVSINQKYIADNGTGSNTIDIDFTVPGTNKTGFVYGFGAVFNDVNRKGSASVSLYAGAELVGTYKAQPADTEGHSFLAVYRPGKKITKARINLDDLTTIDDMMYGSPRRL